jgi:hypothetical protein
MTQFLLCLLLFQWYVLHPLCWITGILNEWMNECMKKKMTSGPIFSNIQTLGYFSYVFAITSVSQDIQCQTVISLVNSNYKNMCKHLWLTWYNILLFAIVKHRGTVPKSEYCSTHHINATNYDPRIYSAHSGLKFKCRWSPWGNQIEMPYGAEG